MGAEFISTIMSGSGIIAPPRPPLGLRLHFEFIAVVLPPPFRPELFKKVMHRQPVLPVLLPQTDEIQILERLPQPSGALLDLGHHLSMPEGINKPVGTADIIVRIILIGVIGIRHACHDELWP
jgi:hypothetical protein